jgi:hypothetical protein
MIQATAPCPVGCSVQPGALVSPRLQAALRSLALQSAVRLAL